MDSQEEWDSIRHLFDTYASGLSYAAIKEIAHFLGVGENEMGFEYLMLYLSEGDTVLSDGDRSIALEVARNLKMEKNEWTDTNFWQKFTELCERR